MKGWKLKLYLRWIMIEPYVNRWWIKIPLILLAVILLNPYTLAIGSYFLLSMKEYDYRFSQPQEQIAQIQLICVSEEVYFYLEYRFEELPGIVDSCTIPCVSLEDSTYQDFLSDFEKITCRKFFNDPDPSVSGGTILIEYRDGSREWISSDGTFYQDSSTGETDITCFYFSDDEFQSFLSQYGYRDP